MQQGHLLARPQHAVDEWYISDFKIGDYGLPTVGREAFGTGTRQRVLPRATVVALGRYVVEQIHVVENRLTT